MSSNFGMSLRHCECYVVKTLDSVVFLQRVDIFVGCLVFASNQLNLAGCKVQILSLGQQLKISSLLVAQDGLI